MGENLSEFRGFAPIRESFLHENDLLCEETVCLPVPMLRAWGGRWDHPAH